MIELLALPLFETALSQYGGWDSLQQELAELGCQGIEGIWDMQESFAEVPQGLVPGYHLTFFSDWLDLYRKDLARAKALNARYLVFHVSNVSIEEGYTYRWRHTHEEVIDASAELINALLAEESGGFDFLMENLWWPGLPLTEPALTERLLSAVSYPQKGLMLDTGHLLNTNPDLRTQAEGVNYIHKILDRHGGLCRYIRGLHFHQSLSGAYVRKHTGAIPPDLPEDSAARFSANYRHILQIDRHQPWTVPEAASIVERLQPDYLTHELAAGGPAERREAVLRQRAALRKTD